MITFRQLREKKTERECRPASMSWDKKIKGVSDYDTQRQRQVRLAYILIMKNWTNILHWQELRRSAEEFVKAAKGK